MWSLLLKSYPKRPRHRYTYVIWLLETKTHHMKTHVTVSRFGSSQPLPRFQNNPRCYSVLPPAIERPLRLRSPRNVRDSTYCDSDLVIIVWHCSWKQVATYQLYPLIPFRWFALYDRSAGPPPFYQRSRESALRLLCPKPLRLLH